MVPPPSVSIERCKLGSAAYNPFGGIKESGYGPRKLFPTTVVKSRFREYPMNGVYFVLTPVNVDKSINMRPIGRASNWSGDGGFR